MSKSSNNTWSLCSKSYVQRPSEKRRQSRWNQVGFTEKHVNWSHLVLKDTQGFPRVFRNVEKRWMCGSKASMWKAKSRKWYIILGYSCVKNDNRRGWTCSWWSNCEEYSRKNGHFPISNVVKVKEWKGIRPKFYKNNFWNCIWNLYSSLLKLTV